MEVSCGFFLIDIESRKLLICKPTGKDTWSIPKGNKKSGETCFDAAKRELFEETNIYYKDLSVDHVIEYREEAYKTKKKQLKAFVVYFDDDIQKFNLRCNAWKAKKTPEIEAYQWVTVDEAIAKVHYLQAEILKSL